MVGGEKQILTPNEIIHQKFGANAKYSIEEVHDSSQCGHPCLYRCHLQLPDFSVVSNVFKKKTDSEQSASELALEKLDIHPWDDDNITLEEAWDDMVERLKYIFSDEFLTADHPLGSHLRATLQRDGEHRGSVPVSAIATFDSKISNLCKVINPSVHSDPILAMSYVMKAASKLSDYIIASPHIASLRRKNPYPAATIKALATHKESIKLEAIYIHCTSEYGEEGVNPVTLDISSGRYYLDVIAEQLGLKDSSQLMISRTFGYGCRLYSAIPKFSPSDNSSKAYGGKHRIPKLTSFGFNRTFDYGCRIYSAIPKLSPSDKSSEAYGKRPIDESSHFKNPWNAKASLIFGQEIHGDAIFASVGYSWRSNDLEHDDVTLKSFYRICYSMSPNGIYKIARNSLIAAHLPLSYTTKSHWRGPLPREILSMFCRQQQLAEPIFTISTAPVKSLSDIIKSHKKLKDSESDYTNNQYSRKKPEEVPALENGYRCEVKIHSTSHDLVLDYSSRKFYEKENYAIQNASLQALSWFNGLFDDQLGAVEPLHPGYVDEVLDGLLQQKIWMKEISPSSRNRNRRSSKSRMTEERKHVRSIPKGSLVSIRYSVYLKVDADMSKNSESSKELIESCEDIEFEIGNGCMNPELELVVTQMSVGQSARFITESPAQGLVLAAATNTAKTRSLFSEFASGVEYRVHLLGVKGPAEKRIESAFFRPPLSKQRIEYAVKHIKESSASTLVDFGCGSGSLLDSLLEYPTLLQSIVGVDISQKRLASAAKMLHSKLNKEAWNLKSVILYDGSILDFDSRLHDIDIATCLEVIEHMEEDQACQFGKIVLSLFRPKLLIVSTPNYEYNTILNKSCAYHSKDKSMSQRSKFRNHDHKFELTRAQFNQWASKLAKCYNYSVEFSGVGGSGKVDHGFASQIALFRRQSFSEVKNVADGSMHPYKVIWEWKKGNEEKKD